MLGEGDCATLILPAIILSYILEINVTMTSSSEIPEKSNTEDIFKTEEECLTAMRNKSSQMTIPHCLPDWDHYTDMCWGPTLAGENATLPCPDDGYLNPNKYAVRMCLPDGSWYINYTSDGKPYTNFDNCFLPLDPSAEDDLKKLVDSKVIYILKSIDEYKKNYIAVHAVSTILLIVAIIACAAVVFKLMQKKHSTLSYIVLTTAITALLINGVVSMSVSAVDDATKVIKCRVSKWVILFNTLIFQESVLGYLYLCIVPILQKTIRPLHIKSTVAATVSLTFLLVTIELLLETFSCSPRYCGFRTLQSSLHWFTTAPRLLLIMINNCLGFVTVFGVLCLRHPHIEKRQELWHIRQKAISVLALALYSVILEILLVLIHSEAYMSYSDLPMDEYLNVFSLAIAAHGIIFSVLMIFFDLGVLSMLGLSFKCSQRQTTANEQECRAFQMYPVPQCLSNPECTGTEDRDHEGVPQNGSSLSDSSRVDLTCHAVKPESVQKKLYKSENFCGFLK